MHDSRNLEKQSSAARLERLLCRAMATKADRSSFDVWADVFCLPADIDNLEKQHRVGELMTATVAELRAMKAALLSMGVPLDLVEPYTSRAEQALAIGALNNRWDQMISGYLGPDMQLALKWFSFQMPVESITAAPEDIAEIAQLLGDLEAVLQRPGLPASLIAIIQKQAAAIKVALEQYPISGVASIRAVARKITVDIHLDEDEIRAAANQGEAEAVQEVGSKLKRVWEKTVSVAGDLEKLGKAGKTAIEVGEFFVKLLS